MINRGKLRRAAEPAIAMLYPRRCPACHEIIPYRTGLICANCTDKMKRIKEPYCMKCGKEMAKEGASLCGDCRRTSHQFERNRAVFRYTGAARASIAQFKFHNRREYADYYALAAQERLADYIALIRPQVILPVPMHRRKKVKRGYNQAEVLARRLSERFQIPYRENVLVRIRHTTPLKELARDERSKELEDAFAVKKGTSCSWRRVLLVDDIYTTGATLDACSRVLKEAGAEKVYGLTLAIGAGLLYNEG